MKLVDKKLTIKNLDLLPRAKNKPKGIPSAIAQTTIFIVSQKPNKSIGV
jgi:hypothetical protein